jgi:hypothetical protein
MTTLLQFLEDGASEVQGRSSHFDNIPLNEQVGISVEELYLEMRELSLKTKLNLLENANEK